MNPPSPADAPELLSEANVSADPALAEDVADTFATACSEIMLLPDGRILAHHLTPELAELLEHLSDCRSASKG
jgi:hypothetical protein